jgi:tRNA pseudouridine55 synthase
VLKLGEETDTQDFTGTVVAGGKPYDFPLDAVQNTFDKFKGAIEQLPPVFSALKHKGMPLYKLARRGKPVQKPPRRVQIYEISIQKIALPLIHFDVTCSAGTYIRTLCADIGKSLGCGGHLAALKRLESSGFTLDQAISLPELEKLKGSTGIAKRMIRMADALPDMPHFCAGKQLIEKIRHGKTITIRDLSAENGTAESYNPGSEIKIVDREGDLIAILGYSEGGHQLEYRCVFQATS